MHVIQPDSTHGHGLRRRLAGSLVLAVVAGCAPALSAAEKTMPTKSLTVVSGDVGVQGGETICFRLTNQNLPSDRVLVRLRFKSAVPRGYLTVDGVRTESFTDRSEEFPFVVDARGTHRVALVLEQPATIDWLSVTSTDTTVAQESCATYEADAEHRVNLEGAAPPPVNRFEPGATTSAPPPRTYDARTPPPPPPSASPRVPATYVPAGTELSLTLEGAIDTRSAYAGQKFRARLAHDVIADGEAALPQGTVIEGHVIESKDAGRFGRSSLSLGFDQAVLADGTTVPVQGSVKRVGKGSAKKQGGIIAGSAVGGALLGKILGGSDKDALLGAIVGGGIAAGSIGAKEGESVVLPAGTVLAVELDANTRVPAHDVR